MKYVTFISGLKTEKVPHFGRDEVRYASFPNPLDDGSHLGMSSAVEITERTVPILEVCGLGKSDMYIAYSEEVEKLLGIPIRAIVAERDAHQNTFSRLAAERCQMRRDLHHSRSQLRLLQESSLYERIKFVFTRKIPS